MRGSELTLICVPDGYAKTTLLVEWISSYPRAGDAVKACTCAPSTATKYQKRISGPLLDRVAVLPKVDDAMRKILIGYLSHHAYDE